MEESCNKGERIDDLQCGGFRLIQNPGLFSFSTDAVLLAEFARVARGTRVVDLGAGNGILDVLMCSRQPDAHYTAIEIAPKLHDLLVRNIQLNGIGEAVTCFLADIRSAPSLCGSHNDLCVCNPPYEKAGSGAARRDETHEAARKETLITFEEICDAASHCLRSGGRFCIVHRTERLAEVLCTLRRHRLEPKLLRMCTSAPGKAPRTFLCMSRKDSKEGMQVMPELIMRTADGQESAELRRIYRRKDY